MSDEAYYKNQEQFGDRFEVDIGAEAIHLMLKRLNLDALSVEIRGKIIRTSSKVKRKKLGKRLQVVEAFRDSGNQPEWMILSVIPVLPPDLRPLIIIRNEKRMLQEAVDVLFDNGRRGRVVTGPNKRPLKSLSDMLKGKQGRFRQNLLGKRVDYSGRSVIVPGPELRLHQCGLPKRMAIELFKPFIYNKLEEKGFVTTIKSAKKMVEKEAPEVWDALDEVVKEFPVLLNRQPTSHRRGIQAFEPILIDEKAIRLHPLVCEVFGADFNEDEMVIHVPLSVEAQTEARVLMMATSNILSSTHGSHSILPRQEIILGLSYMSQICCLLRGKRKIYSSPEEVCIAYNNDKVDLREGITVRIKERLVDTSPGRILIGEQLPNDVPFSLVNQVMTQKTVINLIDFVCRDSGIEQAALLADNLMDLGFEYATKAGFSICISDIQVPIDSETILDSSSEEVLVSNRHYADGEIFTGQKHNKIVETCSEETDETTQGALYNLNSPGHCKNEDYPIKSQSSISACTVFDSKARKRRTRSGNFTAMCCVSDNPTDKFFSSSIKANLRNGLSSVEFFLSTFNRGRRLCELEKKGRDSWYLFRRLINAAHDFIILEQDCGTSEGIDLSPVIEEDRILCGIGKQLLGRVALCDVIDPVSNNIIVAANEEITEDKAGAIEKAGIDKVTVRSVLTCRLSRGACALCYGRDLGRGKMVAAGEAVGVIAAQSIFRSVSKLNNKTCDLPGLKERQVKRVHQINTDKEDASNPYIAKTHFYQKTDVLSYIIDLFETREPKNRATITKIEGQINFGKEYYGKKRIIVTPKTGSPKKYFIPRSQNIRVKEYDYVKRGEPLTDGEPALEDILRAKGIKKFAQQLISKFQKVFRPNGIMINDKHFEVIIRQMVHNVKINNPGDSPFLLDEVVDSWLFAETNKEILQIGGIPATSELLLLGITKISYNFDSFISAASFQNTTRILTDASIAGKVDYLSGLNENIVIGRLIPAGTGFEERIRLTGGRMGVEYPGIAGTSIEPVIVSKRDRTISYTIPVASGKIKKPKELQLDEELVKAKLAETEQVQGVLADIFSSDVAGADDSIAFRSANKKVSDALKGLDNRHRVLLRRLLKKEDWERTEVEKMCKEIGLMIDGALEVINEWAFEHTDLPVIEDGASVFVDIQQLLEILG
jgi:DNA-directed RNA polymerase subunit beta'